MCQLDIMRNFSAFRVDLKSSQATDCGSSPCFSVRRFQPRGSLALQHCGQPRHGLHQKLRWVDGSAQVLAMVSPYAHSSTLWGAKPCVPGFSLLLPPKVQKQPNWGVGGRRHQGLLSESWSPSAAWQPFEVCRA